MSGRACLRHCEACSVAYAAFASGFALVGDTIAVWACIVLCTHAVVKVIIVALASTIVEEVAHWTAAPMRSGPHLADEGTGLVVDRRCTRLATNAINLLRSHV